MNSPLAENRPSARPGRRETPLRTRGIRTLLRTGLCLTAVLLASCAEVQNKSATEKPVNFSFPPPPEEARYILERVFRSSGDVVPEEEDASLKRLVTGTARTGEGLAKPYGVAVHEGRIYVADSSDRSIKVFDVPGKNFFKIAPEDGQGVIRMPLGIAVDGRGTVYVCDATQRQIKVYDKDGAFLRVIGSKDDFDKPASVAVDKEGKRVYVIDIGGVKSDNHRIRVFDAQTGAHVLDIGKRGNADGEFNFPRDAAIGPDGQLYVVDGGNFRVQVFKTDGSFVRKWGSNGNRGGQFARPKGIAVDPSNYVYVADTAFGNFQVFNPEGQLMLDVGGRSETEKPAGYMLPAGIASDEDGRIYMVDQFFRRVDVYRPAAVIAGQGHLFGNAAGAKPETAANVKSEPGQKAAPESTTPAKK
jgi:sugar lactone lactonase YvrE